MKPGETIRLACADCQIVFDICVAPTSEWLDLEADADNEFEPTCCPFCGAHVCELKRLHDRADAVDGPA